MLAYSDLGKQYSFEGQKGFKAEYFANRELTGQPVISRMEDAIDKKWQQGESVAGNIRAYDISVRWTTDFTATSNGAVTFELEGDDGYRFFVDGQEVLNAWTRNRWGARTYHVSTKQGSKYRLVVECYQAAGKASMHLKTGDSVKSDLPALAARLKDVDAVVYVGGISPQLEGEEMKVDYPGFNGGDRTSILRPKVQTTCHPLMTIQ